MQAVDRVLIREQHLGMEALVVEKPHLTGFHADCDEDLAAGYSWGLCLQAKTGNAILPPFVVEADEARLACGSVCLTEALEQAIW